MELRPDLPPLPPVVPERWPELPMLPVLGAIQEKEAFAASLPEFVREVYERAVELLGDDEARALFERATKKKRGERGRARNLAPSLDLYLLVKYDRAARTISPSRRRYLVRWVAGALHEVRPGLYGATTQAIETRLRRLLRDRKRRLAEARSRSSRIRSQLGESSLLRLLSDEEPEKK
jgi:hypothetical protein